MFIVILLLLVFFLTGGVSGLWVALDVRNSATRLERWHVRNLDLRAQASGRLGPHDRLLTATGFRVVGGVLALIGFGMILAPLIAALLG
ncbi:MULTISPECIES: hypothetical protein [unclassified Streptomyces]|uniref:hypothetical protein n=1 Tax=unclassified Streptomyces TaxID=2593676 RepID=UPI0006F54CFC|nr:MULTISPECIES: hypothetical protein [unclassified Streptomyces]KQX59103.1 hypothetical protein ASD33_02050 [Streptomyces sp. Root1304]KRB00364.1 hypothetical protein ASE09_02050 [Streptomyces sp. Root66D1]